MLKLGRPINENRTTVVELYSFDIIEMTRSQTPLTVEFTVKKQPFGRGGFREAFKATIRHLQFHSATWVLKKYLQSTFYCIKQTNQTVEEHTKKSVQMHLLDRNFAAQLTKELECKDMLSLYGTTLRYNKIFPGIINGDQLVTIKEFVSGTFLTYINNDGNLSQDESKSEIRKTESLAYLHTFPT